MNEWQVKIEDEFSRFGKRVHIYRKKPNGQVEIYNSITEAEEVLEFGATPPFAMYLNEEMLDALFNEMQRKGYKPKEQSFVEGKLEAQSSHLEDLRNLLDLSSRDKSNPQE